MNNRIGMKMKGYPLSSIQWKTSTFRRRL